MSVQECQRSEWEIAMQINGGKHTINVINLTIFISKFRDKL
jgi:hypothetical protein